MTANQEALPLSQDDDKPDIQPFLTDTAKKLDKPRRQALSLSKKKDDGPVTVKDLDRLIESLHVVATVLSALKQRRDELHEQQQAAFDRRREDLAQAANAAGWSFQRLAKYDKAGCFQVNYRKDRVTLQLGSEKYPAFAEVDGRRLFSRLQDEKKRLEDFPFDRASFFRSMRDALALARSRELGRNGRVPIRQLFPLFVLARHIEDERFQKRPTVFEKYPMEQFVYDFARFGRDGWKLEGGGRICNQPPNMASVPDALTLPSLDGSKAPQLCAIWID